MSTLIVDSEADSELLEPRTISKRYVFRMVERQRSEVMTNPRTKEKFGPVFAYGIIIKVETNSLDRAVELARPVADRILGRAKADYYLSLRQVEVQENVPDDDRDI